MVDQLNSFASEVSRVAREVGTDGKLGGQAQVPGVAGTWKDLTDKRQLDGFQPHGPGPQYCRSDDCRGQRRPVQEDHRGRPREILQLQGNHQYDVDQLRSFAAEVTRVAREVGTDGKLGGQAQVPGVAGTWKDLTDSVNSMASNLTGQVRNIADVTTAVARGDLSAQDHGRRQG